MEKPKVDYAIWVCSKHRTNGSFGECPRCKEEMRLYLETVEAPPTPRAEVSPADERFALQQWEQEIYAAFGFDWDVVLRDEALDAIRMIVSVIGLPISTGSGEKLAPKEVVDVIRQMLLRAAADRQAGAGQ